MTSDQAVATVAAARCGGSQVLDQICLQVTATHAAVSSANAAWAGIALGALTLVAAIVAAYFAGRAAAESRSSARAAWDLVNMERSLNRPWLKTEITACEFVRDHYAFPERPHVRVMQSARNVGSLPAYHAIAREFDDFAGLKRWMDGATSANWTGQTMFPGDTSEASSHEARAFVMPDQIAPDGNSMSAYFYGGYEYYLDPGRTRSARSPISVMIALVEEDGEFYIKEVVPAYREVVET